VLTTERPSEQEQLMLTERVDGWCWSDTVGECIRNLVARRQTERFAYRHVTVSNIHYSNLLLRASVRGRCRGVIYSVENSDRILPSQTSAYILRTCTLDAFRECQTPSKTQTEKQSNGQRYT